MTGKELRAALIKEFGANGLHHRISGSGHDEGQHRERREKVEAFLDEILAETYRQGYQAAVHGDLRR